jgi:hypothetical protein
MRWPSSSARVARLDVIFQRHDGEDRAVHVIRLGHEIFFRAEERFESRDKLRAQCVVVRRLCELERAIPRARLGVVDEFLFPHRHVRTRDEVRGDAAADFLRRFSGGPRPEVVARTCRRDERERAEESGKETEIHRAARLRDDSA